ncbi:MAG TPA: endonuclease MutS2 [Bacillota bacterium]|nr:endonuclease MutS2 [Bacillota bacterium]
MDKRIQARLEFNKIREQLASFANSPLGKERVMEMEPVSELAAILKWQAETSEGRELMRLDPTAEINGWKDIRVQLRKAGRGAVLEPEDLWAVAETLASSRLIKKFLEENWERYPLLSELAVSMVSLPGLEKKIRGAITPGGGVADGASPELARLRRRILNAQADIKEYLEVLVRSPQFQKYLQDPIVTVREGRYVVPVKIEHRSQIPGIVHDQSASGATLFIEPMTVVERNNELRRLFAAEQQEVHRILAGLSGEVAQNSDSLSIALEALGELDFIMARARYSRSLNAWAPVFEGEASLDIRQGRHPLLKGEVVPLNIRLGYDFDTLVITGPNTGGKTVALKTAGLLVLMAQAGMHIPAGEGSKIGIFRQVFADIGDEQSIEQSLSTFSSHMTNIVDIIRRAGPDSLVLLDELGAGTDPVEGAALARSILERLHSSGAKTIATTHYSELKDFACVLERMENASVDFDAVTLRPAYRLSIGKPGRSNAFEIAYRLGLPADLVERAKSFLTEEQIVTGELMSRLEKTQQEAEAELRRAVRLSEEARLLKEKYEKMESELASRRESIIAKAGEEAKNLVKMAGAEAEAAVRELKQRLAAEAARDRESAVREAREKLKAIHDDISRVLPEKKLEGVVPGDLRPGEEVFLPNYNQRGYVLSPPGPDGEVQIQVGILKMNFPVRELRRVEKPEKREGQSQVAGVMLGKARDVSTELDLRGMYADEAVLQVEKYLDDACLAGLSRVSIIHGKGTGSLRAAVHKQLSGHRRVRSFRLGDQSEGGLGVTVVDLA